MKRTLLLTAVSALAGFATNAGALPFSDPRAEGIAAEAVALLAPAPERGAVGA